MNPLLFSLWMTRRALLASTAVVTYDDPREAVLDGVARRAPVDEMERLFERLVSTDPSRGKGATSDAVRGDWELIWSAKTSKFSPLLELPPPLRPTSTQVLSKSSVANTLQRGVLGPGLTLELSSGLQGRDDQTLEITPPFKFDALIGNTRRTIVDAPSDAVFRQTQARSRDEQLAPRNLYKQLYLDTQNRPGDLRLSKIVAGDPVIVGATFLHRRIR